MIPANLKTMYLLRIAQLLFQNVNCFENQSIGRNIRGNKKERKDPQAKKDENSRELMMKVQSASHWRGSVGLFPKALSPKKQAVVICLQSATGFDGTQVLRSHSWQISCELKQGRPAKRGRIALSEGILCCLVHHCN